MNGLSQMQHELSKLANTLARGPAHERLEALRTLIGPDVLPWQFGRACLNLLANAGPVNASLALLDRLLDAEVLEFVAQQGERRAALLRGMVRLIQAAIAGRLGASKPRYAEEASQAYDEAFAPMNIAGLGQQIVEDALSRALAAPVSQDNWPYQAIILLDGVVETSWVSVLAERIPDGAGLLIPDPIGMGLVQLEDDVLAGFACAWSYLMGRRDRSGDYPRAGVRWSLAGCSGVLARLVGASGTGAFAAAAWSALTEIPLDRRMALSATFAGEARLSPDGPLGAVGSAQSKCDEAGRIGLEHVLFHPDSLCSGFDRARIPKGVQVIEVKTFEAAWEHLAGPVQALAAYARAEQACVADRIRRFRSPRLAPANGSPHLLEALCALHVPFNVLTRVPLPRDDREAFRQESERRAGGEQAKARAEPNERAARHAPPGAPERLRQEEREYVRPFDQTFAAWRSGWSAGPKLQVVLGDPGYGKTWLAGMLSLELLEAYRRARGWPAARPEAPPLQNTARSGDPQAPSALDRCEWLPLRFTCRELAAAMLSEKSLTLAEAAAAVAKERLKRWNTREAGREGVLERLIEEAFERSRVFLILDGWDEQSQQQKNQLRDVLNAWASQTLGPVLVTSRVIGRPAQLHGADNAWMLVPLEGTAGVEQLIGNWFGPEAREQAGSLIASLRASPHLGELVRVPLLAALLCSLWHSGKLPPMPEQRAGLLAACLRHLLQEGCRDTQQSGGAVLTRDATEVVDHLLEILGKIAEATFTGERWLVSRRDLDQRLGDLPQRLTALGNTFDVIDALTGRFGILTEAGEKTLEILHQSFAEHLCAYGIVGRFGYSPETFARNVPGFSGWLKTEEAQSRLEDPRWHEVWCHVAALAPDPGPLLRELADEQKDDVYRHRLALAGCCLGEMGPQARAANQDVVDQITTELFSIWWRHREQRTTGLIRHIERAFPALARANGRVLSPPTGGAGGEPLLTYVASLLGHPDPAVRATATDAVGLLGPAAATPEILGRLAELLRDTDTRVRATAARAVGRLGAKTATPEILALLAELLRDPKLDVRHSARVALGRLGPAADTPEILALLPELLRDKYWRVRKSAADAVGRLGPAAATPEILGRLAELLRDPHSSVRADAAVAVGRLGRAAATPEFLALLAELLRDPHSSVRAGAVGAVGRLGPAAATPEILALLPELLRDSERLVRESAAYAVGGLGPAAATPEFLGRLLELLRHSDREVRVSAADAVGRLGSAAATPEILALLPELLRDPEWYVRARAAKAMGGLGPAAATAEFLGRLAELLRDAESYVRESAAKAMGRLGPAAATPEIVALLPELLRDPDWPVRESSADAMGRLGRAVATPEFLGRLAELLRDTDSSVRADAAVAVGRLGPAAATPRILTSLAKLLRDPEWGVRVIAAKAVGQLGPAVATAELLGTLAELLRDAERHVRASAAEAVGRLGPAAATREILALLAELLRDPDYHVRKSAAEAMGSLMQQGLRLFKDAAGRWNARRVGL